MLTLSSHDLAHCSIIQVFPKQAGIRRRLNMYCRAYSPIPYIIYIITLLF